MIKPRLSHFVTYDNSGIKKCYSINFNRFYNQFGVSHCSLTEVKPRKKFKKGDLLRLVVYGQRVTARRRSGIDSRLTYNGVVATKKDYTPVATRLYGCLYLEARHYGYVRLAVLSKNIL